ADAESSSRDASGYLPSPLSGRSRAAVSATGTGERDGGGNSTAPTFPSYQSHQQPPQHSYHGYQQHQRVDQQYHAEQQPSDSVGAGSPPVSAISQLVISSKNGSHRNATAASHQYQQQQQQHLFQQQQSQQFIQLGRDPATSTSQLNSYLLMSRAQQQQQQQQQQHHQSQQQQQQHASMSSLPSMLHNSGILHQYR
ncbi:hypothetical protein GGI21_006238, partial [Coemansia aciculifera]